MTRTAGQIAGGEPSFPVLPPVDAAGRRADSYPYPDPGITKREHFAALAMQGLVTHSGSIGFEHGANEIAARACELADALLERLYP